ncbi:hypothetical protein J5X84_27020 [Streptosporangiaceae bacterium NEAU-GS5]|nr:hypothetical protein [Streptosporangiaceae bacterium NEAU-GS5]
MVKISDAGELAAAKVRAVARSTRERRQLAASFYATAGVPLRYGRAELSFLRWEVARGVLNHPLDALPGSPWWRAVNDRLLRDKAEAALLRRGVAGAPSARSVELWEEFIAGPSGPRWYRAHNASVAGAFLDHEELALAEVPAERFMMNVALLRVFYTHALVAAPRLALGPFAAFGPLVGDPRRGTVGMFMDLRQVFPQHYPLDGTRVEDLVAAERRLARVLDYGIIAPRLVELYGFAAESLQRPEITGLLDEGLPCYAAAGPRAAWLGRDDPLVWLTGWFTGARRPMRASRPVRPDLLGAARPAPPDGGVRTG